MNVTVGKKELLMVLKICKEATSKKSIMPILGHVLLVASGNRLFLSATDLVLSIRSEVDAEVKSPGSVAVNAKDFFDRVRLMPEGLLFLEVDERSKLTMGATGHATRQVIDGVDGDEFPSMPKQGNYQWVSIDSGALARLIDGTFFSISKDHTRIHLNSALFEIEDGLLRMSATDGHRLAKMEIRVPCVEASAPMLIPRDAVDMIRRLCADAKKGETARVVRSGLFIHVSMPGFFFSSKLNDAQFPPFESVIPKTFVSWARVNRKEFQACVTRALAFASRKTDGLKLTLSNGEATINCHNFNSGTVYSDKIEADYAGEEFTMGLSARYLLDVLKSAEGDGTVALRINGSLDPISVRPSVSSPDYNHIAVIMPMRI